MAKLSDKQKPLNKNRFQLINGKMVDTGEAVYKTVFFAMHHDCLIKPKGGNNG